MALPLGAVLATAALGACKDKGGASADPTGGAAGAAKKGRAGGANATVFPVDILEVESKQLAYIVTAPGTVEAFERVQVTARVAGAVDRVAFSEGQEVKKGTTLVVIDSERFRLSVNSAKAALAKTQAALQDSEAMVARRQGASDQHPGLIPGEELATYKTKTLTAQADVAVAQENLKVAELNLRDSFVRAPIDGVIQTRTVETGQYVNTGYVMATLLRSDPMLLKFQVEPQDAPRIKPGMIATFTMRETQRAFTAKILLTEGSADPETHMVNVTGQVEAENHRYWLRPGSFCDVQLDIGATRSAPVIPRSATRATDHGYVTYVVDGDTASERVLSFGMNTKDGWVEVKSGLHAGDWIVVRGAEALRPGAKVRASKVTSVDGGVPSLPDDSAGNADRSDGAPGDGGAARARGRANGGSGDGGVQRAASGAAPTQVPTQAPTGATP